MRGFTYGVYWKSDDKKHHLAFITKDRKKVKEHFHDDIIIVVLDPKKEYRIGDLLIRSKK